MWINGVHVHCGLTAHMGKVGQRCTHAMWSDGAHAHCGLTVCTDSVGVCVCAAVRTQAVRPSCISIIYPRMLHAYGHACTHVCACPCAFIYARLCTCPHASLCAHAYAHVLTQERDVRSAVQGHNYIGHNYTGHNCTGHEYIDHNYTGRTFMRRSETFEVLVKGPEEIVSFLDRQVLTIFFCSREF